MFLNGRETLEPTKVLHLWAKSQKDVDYTLQWQRSGVPDESSSSTWRFSVVLTPTPKSTKARAGDNQPMCFRCARFLRAEDAPQRRTRNVLMYARKLGSGPL